MIAKWRRPRALQRWHSGLVLGVAGIALCGAYTVYTSALAISPKTKGAIVHRAVTTTVFWVGEQATDDNSHIANVASAWDEQWQAHYGGVDSPDARHLYSPSGFTPKENPFYVALPYDDIDDSGQRRPTASLCPNTAKPKQYSWCKNNWIAIRHGNKVVYAQWEDVGPYQEDDTAYVFGTKKPRNQIDTKAGLDVSPAVRDFLHLGDVSHTNWNFVAASSVPAGPWHQIVTISPGESID